MNLDAVLEAVGPTDHLRIHDSAQQGSMGKVFVSLLNSVAHSGNRISQICMTSLMTAFACLCDRLRSISAGGVLLLAVYKPALCNNGFRHWRCLPRNGDAATFVDQNATGLPARFLPGVSQPY